MGRAMKVPLADKSFSLPHLVWVRSPLAKRERSSVIFQGAYTVLIRNRDVERLSPGTPKALYDNLTIPAFIERFIQIDY